MGNATSNEGLVQFLKTEADVIKSREVEHAMLTVDRGNFLPEGTAKERAYADSPQPIGHGQTISAPHMHAMTMELLKDHVVRPGARVLDVGCGSGIMCGYFAAMVDRQQTDEKESGSGEQEKNRKQDAQVFGIEYVESLVALSQKNLDRDPASRQFVQRGLIRVQSGDGWKGLPEEAPFDAIHVGAAAAKIPEALVEQLAPGGRMVIPVGPQHQTQALLCLDKDKHGVIHERHITSVGYVPLVRSDDND